MASSYVAAPTYTVASAHLPPAAACIVAVPSGRATMQPLSIHTTAECVEVNVGVLASCPFSLLQYERLVTYYIVPKGVSANSSPEDQPCITVKPVVDSTQEARDGGRLSLGI